MKIMVCAAVLISVLTASQGFASDVCSLGKEILLLQDAGREKFYKNKIEGRVLEGKGSVVNAWQRGSGKNYTVSIDCGNDVVINVETSADTENLKVGQQVDFKGICVSYGSRRYIYSKKTYMVIGMERGSVGKINHEPK
jgi:hypothetical protein